MSFKKNIFFFVTGLILFATFSFLVFHDRHLSALDWAVYQRVAEWNSPWWIKFNLVVSALGSGPVLYLLCFLFIIYWALKGGKLKTVLYGILLIVGMFISGRLKLDFDRIRPLSLAPGWIWTTFSYPSGHAFGSLYFYGITLWIFFQIHPDWRSREYWGRGLKGASLFLVLLIGLSRVALGAHWVSDVIGGYFLAFTWFFLARLVIRKF